MKLSAMVDLTNRLTGQGTYTFDALKAYFDEAIDLINEFLATNLPLVSQVYEADFELVSEEDPDDYTPFSLENKYTRIPAMYLRNFICYHASWAVQRDEDEDEQVYIGRQIHADSWRKKLFAHYGDFELISGHSILIGGDVPGRDSKDDTAMGFYNPYAVTYKE